MVTAMVAIALAFYRLVGFMAVVHYCFLIFAVGPWFAYLASECLPLRAPQLRTAMANMLARRFSGDPRVRYVNLGRALNIRDTSLVYDGLHLVARGNQILADALAPTLLEMIK